MNIYCLCLFSFILYTFKGIPSFLWGAYSPKFNQCGSSEMDPPAPAMVRTHVMQVWLWGCNVFQAMRTGVLSQADQRQ